VHAINLSPYETLMLVEWTHTYYNQLIKFGCRDDSLYNGFINLCNTYASKIHSTLIDKIQSLIQAEASMEVICDQKSKLMTNSPDGLREFFEQPFEVLKIKKIKELMLKMLNVYQEITY
jgi:hypothetical protein